MARLELLPLDISISCLLPYISPKDFDTFCLSCPRFETWCLNSANIHYYLSLHNISYSQNDGLLWAFEVKSTILMNYFLSFNSDVYNCAMAYAAREGNISIVNLMLSLGADDYDWAMIEATRGGDIEIVKLMLDCGAIDYYDAIIEAEERGYIEIIKLLESTSVGKLESKAKIYQDEINYRWSWQWELDREDRRIMMKIIRNS